MNFTRVFDILDYQQQKYPEKKALNTFEFGKWRSSSIEEIQEQSDVVSCWLLEQGLQKGDKVAIIPRMGRTNWMIIDFACQQVGVVVVPLHPTASEEDFAFILKETECKMCITADTALFYKLSLLFDKQIPNTSLFHLSKNEEGFFPALKLKKANPKYKKQLEVAKANVHEKDTLVIMYTSGTSGQPKGVVLTHYNVVSSIKSALAVLPLNYKHKIISFLPFSHIFERTACYAFIAFGVSLYFAQNRENLASDFKRVKPFMFTSVPRILEKMYDLLKEEAYTKNLLKKVTIKWAIRVGKKYRAVHRFNPWYSINLFFARLLVLNQWKGKLGGKIRYIVVGAAALRPDIARLFSAAGIKVRSGYGMTETSPFITTNRFEPGLNDFETVGIVLPGVEIKINEPNEKGDGEILVKGANVMQGYFKRPELNKAVFTLDGWLKTGDVGTIVKNKFLKITGRQKDIFKTSSGKYIAPVPLQDYFKSELFIEHCLIVGFQRPYVTGIVVPNFTVLERWCEKEKIHWTSPQFMVHNIRVREKFEQEINHLNEKLPNYQTMRNFLLCHEDWSIETGEYSAAYKLVRHKLVEKHAKEIDKMY